MPVTRRQYATSTTSAISSDSDTTASKKDGRGRPSKGPQKKSSDDIFIVDNALETMGSLMKTALDWFLYLLTLGCYDFYISLANALFDAYRWVLITAGIRLYVRPVAMQRHLSLLYSKLTWQRIVCFVLMNLTGDFVSDTVFTAVPVLNTVNRPITMGVRKVICTMEGFQSYEESNGTVGCPYREDPENPSDRHVVATRLLTRYLWDKMARLFCHLKDTVITHLANKAFRDLVPKPVKRIVGAFDPYEDSKQRYGLSQTEMGGFHWTISVYNSVISTYEFLGLTIEKHRARDLAH